MIYNKRLSRYSFLVAFDEGRTIVYNSMNGAVVLLENRVIKDDFREIASGDLEQLEKMGFLGGEAERKEEIEKKYSSFKTDTLSVILEMTQACNLRCSYCYQSDWEKSGGISAENLDRLLLYISKSAEAGRYSSLELGFFGGEPLLEKKKISDFYGKLKKVCGESGLSLKLGLQTNGLLLTRDFLSGFDSLQVTVPLSPKEDHDSKRFTPDKGGSYGRILENILACRPFFENPEKYRLTLRFNADRANKELFPSFVSELAAKKIKCAVKTSYTHEHAFNPLRNTWSLEEYQAWNSSAVIDALVEHGFRVTLKPGINRAPCTGYAGHNVKVFSDGTLGLCNGYFPERRRISLEEACSDPGRILEFFPEKKQLPFDNEHCLNCRELFLCGGMKFCRQKPCSYSYVDLPVYLRTYVKHILNGKASLFDFSKT